MTQSNTPEQSTPPQQTQTSPLAEANPKSLEELFSRDPFEFSEQDEIAIVAALRAQRANWAAAEAAGNTPAQKARATKSAGKTTMNLDDLGLA